MASTALRNVQINAHSLDARLRKSLHDHIEKIVMELPIEISRMVNTFIPELRLLVDVIMWISFTQKGCSQGQEKAGIRYEVHSNFKRALLFLLAVLPSYINSRFTFERNQSGAKFLIKLEALKRFVTFLFHFRFIRYGGCKAIAEELLKLRAIYDRPAVLGTINYSALNREYLLLTCREFIIFVKPLLNNFIRCVRFGKQILKNNWKASHESKLGSILCSRCQEKAILPIRNSCGHVACYYCHHMNMLCGVCWRIFNWERFHFV